MSFKGVVLVNNSVIQITEIGSYYDHDHEVLQCITDKIPCCGTPPHRAGEWYFPYGGKVPIQGGATSFYRSRGDNGEVNLNRLSSNIMMPTGRFCCKVPDATNTLQIICATILSSKYHKLWNLIEMVIILILFLLQSLSRLLVAQLLQL